ncbi:helix-turn-helix domain-containing protein [Vulcanisaeta distributa]|uniref:RNA polymerase, sigma-24 subunit, ECF subfamily n=1 Tax=Vulcanisaeta distributa (strain DSM 14429 / JCM 11212 / NBRC 100878 / IC-017) TaxID=572478 RepID=E1QUK6_VULDI|nr:sigma factor-like helix-turn-helix DNA-binding protein [Vulcanisaeta distributa]ADN51125.1 RNA polymerase, sigma-24 subunit, ECF subfamily [Vulcanisaeta distributa DSM 14429]
MSSKLTKTEELAAKLYFNEGLKPKEIAQKLGISVNTVYKAISKYRAFTKNIDQALNQLNDDKQLNKVDTQMNNNNSSYLLGGYGNILNVSLSIITGMPDPQLRNDYLYESAYQGELIKELKSLKELIGKLIEKVEELEKRSKDGCIPGTVKGQDIIVNNEQFNNDSLPDFIRDNPWIDVIKSIHADV